MKTTGLLACFAILVSLFGCEKPSDYPDTNAGTVDSGAEDDSDGSTVETYPMDRWGYKPAVHSEQGALVKTTGDVLPMIEIGGIEVSQSIWQSNRDLVPVIWSILDCPPCSWLYEDATEGYVMVLGAVWNDVEMLQADYPALTFIADSLWRFGTPWESDYWPDTVRGYPTTQWVSSETMEIAYEIVGYGNDSIWSAERTEKDNIWKGVAQ